ncbi:MAG: transporter substrate-binding domain-containing protein [Clostridia bacterium]|nr:transporter substrate-binding domain-containing protein [Clostridia bacterium]
MKKALRIVSVIMMVFLLFTLGACSKADTQNTTTDESSSTVATQAEQSEAPTESAPPASAEPAASGSKDLIASLAQLPGLADSSDKGAFVDLVKAMDEVYTEGNIKIEVYPFGRSIENVSTGKADFHIPSGRPLGAKTDESKLPFRSSEKPFGVLSSVLYSNVDKKITTEMLNEALKKGGTFPYKIEVLVGSKGAIPYPSTESSDIKQSFEKLKNKRIDAFINPQEESDKALRELKYNNIYRSLWSQFEDVIAIPNNDHGKEVEKILNDCLSKMEASGKLKELYYKIHQPYDNWQPSEMGW